MIQLKKSEEFDTLRESGKRLANVVDRVLAMVKSGITTRELDEFAEKLMRQTGDEPAFLNYKPAGADRPFPATLCVSVNDEIVHGIPNEGDRVIEEGDVVTIDTGIKHKGMITDHAITMIVGDAGDEARKLLNVTREALMSGIKQAQPGNRIGDISSAIEAQANKHGYSVVKGLAGHGVGYEVHEDPYVPNQGRAGTGEILQPGLVIAIEPMFTTGNGKIKLGSDGYTYKTADGELSAQFEHTVLITESGPEILTKL
jgi:methionyl aminopeptidase